MLHHVHNAEFLHDYPNMPASLSPTLVYIAWTVATAIGASGYFLLRRGYRFAGLGLLALYGCYGLDALVHYVVAPLGAHTPMMHFTIGLEAATAAALLVLTFRRARAPTSP